jgi:hypothetical protein
VQDGDGAGHGSQPTAAYAVERLERRLEEKRVSATSVGQEERMQSLRYGEDQVKVFDREQVARLGFHPAGLVQALALGAVAIPTGVEEGDLTTAVIAHLEVAAQKRRPARGDVSDHPAAVGAQSL